MVIVTEIIERLKDIISRDYGNKKVFDKDVAKELDITQVNFATMKNRGKIPYDKILDFCAKKKISINWLLYNQHPESLVESTDRYWIKYYPNIKVSAGGGSFEANEEFEKLDMPLYFVDFLGGIKNIKNIEAIKVVGDSMEPTLQNESIVFIDKSKTSLTKGAIYAFLYEDSMFVKRVVKKGNELIFSSDNDVYDDMICRANDIVIYGKILSSLNNLSNS
ncbi:MAG: helix-turn-helix transcriptional regulator [Arcobacter butzleri]|jgi:SOS-response transcriptional repressor LexA|nr:helix-turn-helix domain-containing protein [Arcobacteraceae bacterium]MDY0365531.1 S24 family peptidase [Arcobacteraceae bacterium]NLO18002.1 helix-turn-helix transcriptional regulator [Aliarcobacter butzleri]